MFFELIGTIVAGVAAAPLVWAINRTLKGRLPSWLVPVAAGAAMLAATISSVMKNEHDLAIGNVVGSNIFNLLGVIGISGVIRAYELPSDFLRYDYFYMLLLTVFLFFTSVYFVLKDKLLSRIIGVVLLLMYITYMVWQFVKN